MGRVCKAKVMGRVCKDKVMERVCKAKVMGRVCKDKVMGRVCKDKVMERVCKDKVIHGEMLVVEVVGKVLGGGCCRWVRWWMVGYVMLGDVRCWCRG